MALSKVVRDELAHKIQDLGAVLEVEVSSLRLGNEDWIVFVLGVNIVNVVFTVPFLHCFPINGHFALGGYWIGHRIPPSCLYFQTVELASVDYGLWI